MTDDGDRPAGLRDLADVQSPDVLRTALRRFRLQIALWVGVILLAGAMVAVVLTAPDVGHLFDQYTQAPRHHQLGAVEEVDGATLVLLDTARIREDRYAVRAVGLTEYRDRPIWAVSPSFASPGPHSADDGQITEIASSIQAPGVTEIYFTMPLQARHAVIHLVPHGGGDRPLAVFNLDLSDYDVIDAVVTDE